MKLFKLQKEKYKTVLYLFGIKITRTKKYDKLCEKYDKLAYTVNDLITKNLRYRCIINEIIEAIDNDELKERIIRLRHLSNNNVYDQNIKNPKSFNEKISWLSLYYYKNDPEAQRACDKITFKDFVKEKLGEGYTARLIKTYDTIQDINLDELPDKFVIKLNCGGDSSRVKIVKDKSSLNINDLRFELREWFTPWGGVYYHIFSGAYKNIKPKILVEEYLEGLDRDDSDYKFFCFNGEPKLFYIANNWGLNKYEKLTLYNMNFENLKINYSYHPRNKEEKIDKPMYFDEMVEIAKKLSKGFPFVRVDLNKTKDKVYAGELTFTPGGGISSYSPVEWDYKLGEMLDISDIVEEYNNRNK